MSKQHRTTIQINGKIYDAISGNLISSKPAQTVPKTNRAQVQNGSIDGFVSKTQVDLSDHKLPNTIKVKAKNPKSSIKPANNMHSTYQHSQTLHRKAVAKPNFKSKNIRNTFLQSGQSNNSSHPILGGKNQQRLIRANQTHKSVAVSKFFQGLVKSEEEIISKSLSNIPHQNVQRSTIHHFETNNDNIKTHTSEQTSSEQTSQDNYDSQIKNNTKRKKQRNSHSWIKNSRTKSLIATSLTAILLVGYITYINIPRAALKIASSKAGFSAQLPGYNPSGFKFAGPISYAPGQIILEYKSNTDDRRFSLTQKETAWDSQTLLDNYVLEESDLYSTYQERGLIVYIFGSSNATWVNGGIWYTITGSSNLTAEQMLKIAASL